MGRLVKRVTLDFDWPMHEVWSGYLTEPSHEPPHGEGWQMWETTTEGSPISPVFMAPEDLARWLYETKASSFAWTPLSYEEWLAIIRTGEERYGLLTIHRAGQE